MSDTRESTPKVTDVIRNDDSVMVTFEDGHRAAFVPYRHSFVHQVEGLRNFYLYNSDVQVVWFNGRLHRSEGDSDHRVERAAEGYTPERIASYWAAAREHIDREFDQCERNTPTYMQWSYPWRVVCCEGFHDLDMLEHGQTQPA